MDNVKFKVRCSKYILTLAITGKEKAEKLKQLLLPGLAVKELKWTWYTDLNFIKILKIKKIYTYWLPDIADLEFENKFWSTGVQLLQKL